MADTEREPTGEQEKQPTMEELREEFMKTLGEPIEPAEREEARTQILMCDIHTAQLRQALAGLEAQIANIKAEIAKNDLARAIINRRLANEAK